MQYFCCKCMILVSLLNSVWSFKTAVYLFVVHCVRIACSFFFFFEYFNFSEIWNCFSNILSLPGHKAWFFTSFFFKMLKAYYVKKTRQNCIQNYRTTLNTMFYPNRACLFWCTPNKAKKLSNLRWVKYLVSHNGISIGTINSFKSAWTQSPMWFGEEQRQQCAFGGAIFQLKCEINVLTICGH